MKKDNEIFLELLKERKNVYIRKIHYLHTLWEEWGKVEYRQIGSEFEKRWIKMIEWIEKLEGELINEQEENS